MSKKKSFNWDEFQDFFSNFNPYQYGSALPDQGVEGHIQDLFKEKLLINTEELDQEYLIDVILPETIDYDKITQKVINKSRPSGKTYKTLRLRIPKSSK